jgi:large subunit ribosomal protein L13
MSQEKNQAKRRFIGWQKTPLQQASFGRTTKSGRLKEFEIKNSTGTEQAEKPQSYLLDASKLPVGRLSTIAASLLSGKHKPSFTPGANSGDQVIIVNADKAYFTSNKSEKKIYYWHTGFMGGLKMKTAGEALADNPEKVLFEAVEGMLPKNRLSQRQLVSLKIYKGSEHPHKAQKPIELNTEKAGSLKMLSVGGV